MGASSRPTVAAPDVRVTTGDFDLGGEYERVRRRAPSAGAIATFVGCVRDFAPESAAAIGAEAAVTALELEHYPGVTEASVEALALDAWSRFPLEALTVVHRVGRLGPGDQIVLVVSASAHRAAAYDANRFVMDFLKTRAVFWKKEHRSDGARWIESRDDDHLATGQWHRGPAGARGD